MAISPGLAQETTTNVYDALGRLVSSSKSGGSNNGEQATYSFDPAGNRSQVTTAVAVSASSVSVTGGSALEGSPLVFTVTRSGTVRGVASITYSTAVGSAVAGSDYQATSGTLVFAANETSKTVSVPTLTDSIVEGNESFSLNLSGATGTTLGNASATGTINDNVAGSSLSIADASAQEGSAVIFPVTRSGSQSMSASVNYVTANGSAQAGSDYSATSGILNFVPGEATKTISVPTNGDPYAEGNETFSISLSSVVGSAIGNGTATGTIIDVVPPSSLAIADASASEGGAVTFTVTRTGSSAMYSSVNYGTSNGSAQAGSDYTAVGGTLNFAPGEASKTISVPTNSDAYAEGNETFAIHLSSASATSIAQGDATGTIVDVVPASSMSVNDASASEGGGMTFTVTRNGSTQMYSSVNYSTSDGSASAGSDYNPVSGTLNFRPGETSKTVSVQTLSDSISEGNENFYLNLGSPSATSIGRGQGVGTIQDVFVNHPPTAQSFSVTISSCEDTDIGMSGRYSDPDGDAVTIISATTSGYYGNVAISDYNTISYSAVRQGTDTVTYTVRDSHGATTTATITVRVVARCS